MEILSGFIKDIFLFILKSILAFKTIKNSYNFLSSS